MRRAAAALTLTACLAGCAGPFYDKDGGPDAAPDKLKIGVGISNDVAEFGDIDEARTSLGVTLEWDL